jgi:hypothetical protein
MAADREVGGGGGGGGGGGETLVPIVDIFGNYMQ